MWYESLHVSLSSSGTEATDQVHLFLDTVSTCKVDSSQPQRPSSICDNGLHVEGSIGLSSTCTTGSFNVCCVCVCVCVCMCVYMCELMYNYIPEILIILFLQCTGRNYRGLSRAPCSLCQLHTGDSGSCPTLLSSE